MFDHLNHFTADEWPAGVLHRMQPALIVQLDALRERLGQPIHPSPLPDGWARTTGSTTSRHYAVNRLSDAGDVFPEGDIRDAWLAACGIRAFGGIGVYFDTHFRGRPWPMLHVDLRPGERIMWARIGGRYVYPHRSPAERDTFFELMNRAMPKAA